MCEIAACELIGAARRSTHLIRRRKQEKECGVLIQLYHLLNVQLMTGYILERGERERERERERESK